MPFSPYRMPAEWERHAATWLTWPQRRSDWPGKFDPIPWVYAEIVRHLARHERVMIIVNTFPIRERVRKLLLRYGIPLEQIDFMMLLSDRSWVRDYGPIYVFDQNGRKIISHWCFNAWAKYEDWKKDRNIPVEIARRHGRDLITPKVEDWHVVLEGGSIDVNGQGLLLTTEECLLSEVQARNPTLSRVQLEQVFRDYLGAQKVLWLGQGIVGDDTHGHIDDVARFVRTNTIVLAVEDNPVDENYRLLQDNRDRLTQMRDLNGHPLQIIELPMPEPVVFDGQRLPASYANFYIANQCVLVPTFNDPNDYKALGILAEVFPDHEVIGIHSGDLVWGLGTLHCLTQQEPWVQNDQIYDGFGWKGAAQ